MKTRVLSMLLALVMAFGLAVPAFAAEDAVEAEEPVQEEAAPEAPEVPAAPEEPEEPAEPAPVEPAPVEPVPVAPEEPAAPEPAVNEPEEAAADEPEMAATTVSSERYTYTFNSTGDAVISKYVGSETDVVIPSTMTYQDVTYRVRPSVPARSRTAGSSGLW